MSGDIITAIVSGAFAVIVAGVSGLSAYLLGKRNLNQRLAELKESGAQDRETAERQYQLEAMKTFREAVGAPKSQIIEAVHDLSDRLRRFLAREQDWKWTEDPGGYFRTSFTWLLVRPFVWIEILRKRMVYLDQTLGDLVERELRFLGYCTLLQQALTDPDLFRDTEYDRNVASARVFTGSLRAACDKLIKRENSEVVVSYAEFEAVAQQSDSSATHDIEFMVANLDSDEHRHFRVAGLVALYCAANVLLQEFHLPFRKFDSLDESLAYLNLVPESLRQPIRQNLERMLKEWSPSPVFPIL